MLNGLTVLEMLRKPVDQWFTLLEELNRIIFLDGRMGYHHWDISSWEHRQSRKHLPGNLSLTKLYLQIVVQKSVICEYSFSLNLCLTHWSPTCSNTCAYPHAVLSWDRNIRHVHVFSYIYNKCLNLIDATKKYLIENLFGLIMFWTKIACCCFHIL